MAYTSLARRAAWFGTALRLAQQTVARRWPEFANLTPTATRRRPAEDGTPRSPAYTFTFTTELPTPEGYLMPRVAHVTVDGRERRVIKAVVSK